MDPFLKRTWVKINLDAIEKNYINIRKKVTKQAKIMCVVKADAYGHGAIKISDELENLGADWFGVSNAEEAIQLRKNGTKIPILILGYTQPNLAGILAKYNITQTVSSLEHAKQLSQYASENNINLNIHIKIDTGMNRLGITNLYDEHCINTVNTIEEISKLKGIYLEGLFTHFAVADEGEDGVEYTNKQYNMFIKVTNILKKRGININLLHCCNSSAVIDYPEMALDMVRPGIILYGISPSEKLKNKLHLTPVMTLKSTISHLKTIDKDSYVSYGKTFKTLQKTTVATVPIGYADGYPFKLSNKGYMLVNEALSPVLGRVCMDQTIIDVTNIKNVNIGDKITVFGKDNNEELLVEKLAKLSETVSHEIVSLIGRRVTRVYYKNGEIIDKINYIL